MTVGAQLVMVISVVVNTVEVVKDIVGGVVFGVEVTIVGLVGEVTTVLALDAGVDTATVLVETDDDGVDTPGVLSGVVPSFEDGEVTTVFGVETGVLEGVVVVVELEETMLLVSTEVVLVKTDDEMEVPTLLVGVLVGKVDTGVEAERQSKPTL